MTLTIDVPRDVERALRELAKNSGQSMPEYVAAILARAARSRSQADWPDQETDVAGRLAAVARIGSYVSRAGLPPLSDDVVDDVYQEREDGQF